MSHLQDFLSVLTASEIAKINKERFIGVEKQVLDVFMSIRGKSKPSSNEIAKNLGITLSHYYKICSLLLDKSYAILIPEKGYELLVFLNGKDLYGHFTHELLLQEKTFDKNSYVNLEEFYFNVFMLLQKVSASDLDEELLESYGEKYLNNKKNKSKGDEYMVKFCIYNTKLTLQKATKKKIENSHQIGNELLSLEKEVIALNHPRAEFYFNNALSTYFHQTIGNPKNVIIYQQKNIDIITKNNNLFDSGLIIQSMCRIAEMKYMDNKFEESYNEYKNIFSKYDSELKSEFYHISRYAQLAIINEDFENALIILNTHFSIYVESKKQGPGVMGALLYAKYYIFNDYEQSNKYIQLAKRLVNKNMYVQYEFEIRMLENIYFALINDVKTAKTLVKRNLKFMYSKGLNLKNSEMIYVVVLLQEILKNNFKTEKFGIRLKSKYASLQKSYAAIYGKIISVLIEKYQLKTDVSVKV